MDVVTPWAEGELLGFDLETTGVDRFFDLPVSFALVRTVGGVVTGTDAALVDPGREIPTEATEVHGISTEQARDEGMPLLEAIERISDVLIDASVRDVPVVGMNLSYDLTILDLQYREFFLAGLAEDGWRGPALDALTIDRHVDRYRKGKRRLESLCLEYGVVLDDAHEASADALASVRVVMAMAERYAELAEASPAELHSAQAQWHREWAVSFDEFCLGNGKQGLDPSEFLWPISWQIRRSAVA